MKRFKLIALYALLPFVFSALPLVPVHAQNPLFFAHNKQSGFCTGSEVICYDFNNNSSSGWTSSITAGSGVTLAAQNQRLEIIPPSGSSAANYGKWTQNTTFGLSGKEVSARVSFPNDYYGEELYYSVTKDASNYLYFTISGNSPDFHFFKVDGGTQTDVTGAISMAGVVSNYAYLRIRESSGTIYVDRSPDRITWTNITSTTVSWTYTSSLTFAFECGSFNSGTTTAFWIDDFAVK